MGTEIFKIEEEMTESTKLPLLYLQPTYGTSFAFIASHENAEDHQRSA